jgi:hypothetical protein
MSRDPLEAARRDTLDALHALEASDRALNRVLHGPCGPELQGYLVALRRARERCEALERVLLDRLSTP